MANKSFVVQYIIKAREQYVQVAGRVKTASEGMRAAIDKTKHSFAAAGAQIRRTSRQMRVAIEKTKQAFISAGQGIRNAGAAMTVGFTLPFALATRSFKNAARDAQETRSKFATVFNTMGPQAEAAAEKLAAGYGLAGTQARKLLGDTGDLLTGFGFSQEATLDLSTRVNQLAVDLASFTNFSGGAEGASAALTKALLGERESLKTLGIAILEEDVKKRVALERSQGMRFATERQAKANATLSLALEQSKNAIGDFARTQHDLANQERITAARIIDLKESFGRVLLPVALKVTKVIRKMAVALTELSPGAKKVILVLGAVLAVVGPLLIALGGFLMILPALQAGLAAVGAIIGPVLFPLIGIAALVAAAAFLIIKNWDKVKAFFSGFSAAIQRTLGPTLSKLVDDFKKAAAVVVELFGGDSEAATSLMEFQNIGELVGQVIGTTLDLLIRGLSGIGSILGQLIAAVVSMDFSQFDIEAIKAEFSGTRAEPILAQSRVDVGVNVGLDQGLKQTAGPIVSSSGTRRTDVGMVTP